VPACLPLVVQALFQQRAVNGDGDEEEEEEDEEDEEDEEQWASGEVGEVAGFSRCRGKGYGGRGHCRGRGTFWGLGCEQ